MKKLFTIIFAVILLTSCAVTDSNSDNDDSISLSVVIADPYVTEAGIIDPNHPDGNMFNTPGLFNYKLLAEKTGMTVEYRPYDFDSEATRILAGDSEVDIYLFPPHIAKLLKDKESYLPIESQAVAAFNSDCFDCLTEFCIGKNGETIMMPVAHMIQGLFMPNSVADELDIKDIEYLDGYLSFVKSYIGERKVYSVQDELFLYAEQQYNSFYCDLKKGEIDYNTETYKNLYSSLLDGWSIYTDSYPWYCEPLSQDMYKSDKSLVTFGSLGSFMAECKTAFTDWRLMPMPKIDGNVKADTASGLYAYINPSTHNKKAAELLLETIASEYFDIVGLNGGSILVFDELSRYPSSIDTGSQVFSDFLKLSENSMIFPYNLDTYRTDIIGYQNGTLTLDEAIAERTRVVDVMLNE